LNPLQYPPGGTSGIKEPIKGKEIVDDSNPEEEHSPSPAIKTQMVLPVKELPHFEGTKREDVITFEIAQGAGWTDKEWVLTMAMADLLGGHVAPLARWIRRGLSAGQPIDQEVVVHHLLEAYGDGQTLHASYEMLEQCHQ